MVMLKVSGLSVRVGPWSTRRVDQLSSCILTDLGDEATSGADYIMSDDHRHDKDSKLL